MEAREFIHVSFTDAGIRIPLMLSLDEDSERIIKEYIEGPTIFDMVRDEISVEPYITQVREMADAAKKAGLNCCPAD